MADVIGAYLSKRADPAGRTLEGAETGGVDRVVVLPCLAEHPGLLDTLHDLDANDAALLADTLVICVVNNRAPTHAAPGDAANNQEALAALRAWNGTCRLAWVDAASPGRELGPKDGVGLARKLGLDWGARILHANERPDAPLISLDGDTRVAPDFLSAQAAYFAETGRWAGVADYAHPLTGGPEDAAILAYETFLRYHELGLAHAGSLYAYPTVGSTIACTARAYATAGGMNRRQAAEDFYFLQQLAKTGHVARIPGARVMPAARPSHRVPFGTGRSIQAYGTDQESPYHLYHPEGYALLRQWLAAARAASPDLPERAGRIHPQLEAYLRAQGFAEAWERIRANTPGDTQRLRRFHEWFDAFRTLKLLHHLRDHGLPKAPIFVAVAELAQMRGDALPLDPAEIERSDLRGQRTLLEALRGLTGQGARR